MKWLYRIVAINLIVPLLFLGVLCCNLSEMAALASCCDTSSTNTKSKNCKSSDCFKISGIVDQNNYSKSIAISKGSFPPNQFVLASSETHYPALRFFNYQSLPKIVQNSPSFYLQTAVRPPPFSIL